MTIDILRRVMISHVAADGPDLSARQLAVLLHVGLIAGPHTVRGLAATLGVAKPAITRALDRLGDDPNAPSAGARGSFGLVKRRVDPSDRRSVLVTITDAGAMYLNALNRRIVAAEQAEQREGGGMSVIDEIAAERRRQIEAEGWTPEHDDEHRDGKLSRAAACYAVHASAYQRVASDVSLAAYRDANAIYGGYGGVRLGWPWSRSWWKPKSPRSDLIRAAALLVAEIERLDRATGRACVTCDTARRCTHACEAEREGGEHGG